jgi:hypothetical protein
MHTWLYRIVYNLMSRVSITCIVELVLIHLCPIVILGLNSVRALLGSNKMLLALLEKKQQSKNLSVFS